MADETSTTPLEPVSGPAVITLTSWQVQNMSTEAAGGGGILGADLNQMLPMPTGSPQTDDIIGGWLQANQDPAQQAAYQLIGSANWTDPEQVVFPTEVVTLFVADLVGHESAPTGATASPTSSVTSGAAFDGSPLVADDVSVLDAPCSAVSDFVTGVLDQIFGALKVDPTAVANFVSGTVGGALGSALGTAASFIASWWDKAVDLAEQTVKDTLANLTAPLVNALALVVGGLATISLIKSYLKPWTAKVTATPAANKFGVGSTGEDGDVKVSIDTGALTADWPKVIVDCAERAGLTLPMLSRPGAPATWQITQAEPGLVTAPELKGVLDKNLESSVHYVTGTESTHLAKTGQEVSPLVTFKVKVSRTEIEELRDFIKSYIASKVPSIASPISGPILSILNSYVDLAVNSLGDLVAVPGVGTVAITHHIPKPVPGCTPSGDTIPAGRYSGHFTVTIEAHLHAGPGTPTGGSVSHGRGVVTIVSNGRTVTGTMKVGGPGTTKTDFADDHFDGDLTVKISGSASNPQVHGSAQGVSEIAGHLRSPFNAGLHVTGADCSSVSGDVIAMYQQEYAPYRKEVTISGSGSWNAPRTN